MFRIIKNIDTKYLKEIENKISSNFPVTFDEINYFLECIIYIVRSMIMENSDYFEYKCDLAQSIICHYFNDLNVANYPNMTINSITGYIVGHSFVVATFNVLGEKVNFLIDPTYIQFFKRENCTADRYIVVDGIIVRTPDPGYFISSKDRDIIHEFNYNGFSVLTEEIARIYGNSFYNTKTMVRDRSIKELKASVYINSFLKGKEKLSKTREELIKEGYYLSIHSAKLL